MQELIYENITELKTPVGYFFVTDGNVSIPFSVRKNTFDVPYHIYDNKRQVIGELNTETNFDLVIDTSKLKSGYMRYWVLRQRGTSFPMRRIFLYAPLCCYPPLLL